MSLLVANHYQLEKESRLVANWCQLEFCKNLVTIRGPVKFGSALYVEFRQNADPSAEERRFPLEVEADLRRQGSRRYVMRAAESGEEIVNRLLIADVNRSQAETPLVTVAAEKIVVADSQVKQVAGRDARRIVIVVLGSRSRNLQEL